MSQTSTEGKRNRQQDSPKDKQQQASLALPSHAWKHANPLTTAGNKLGLAGLSNPNDVGSSAAAAADDNRPSASGSGTFASGGATTTNVQTDFDAMNDAVGIAGVDIAAEEELARTQSNLYRSSHRNYNSNPQLPPQPYLKNPRVKILDFLDKPALTLMVQHIAASFQLKTLEPAILDVLTQAAEARMHTVIVDSIGAKDHRVASSHLRAPPLYGGAAGTTTAAAPKGKQKEREPAAMYDQLVYEHPERMLSMLARVEGEEERKARLEREATETEGEGLGLGLDGGGGGQEQQTTADSPAPGGGGVNREQQQQQQTPHEKGGGMGVAKKEKKRKREGPGQLARNMSEDARARQSNQTAMRSVGGRSKYSWLSGGVPSTGLNKAPLPTTLMASLPAPKFAPQAAAAAASSSSSQPGPPVPPPSSSATTAAQDASPHASSTPTGTTTAAAAAAAGTGRAAGAGASWGKKEAAHGHHLGGRLGGALPPKHAASSSPRVGLNDCLFALERERGTGAGKGTGSKSLFKAYLSHNASPTLANPAPSSALLDHRLLHNHPSSTSNYYHSIRK
ncbi:hypothetical protein PCANC_21479 [Puccinia coronata f. sp. avenae]|uniref:Transcription initiation factor TFIID subunit 4 n=1 Tax=Puccinia coronata f. sp. avenae TaxID=200324 RepID=A0A2N5U021_9BASI|nr:hypothetical protein PCANC_21479 [Puccinia coronata f. sp. avenae]